jgi:hypothetical protein
MTLPSAPRPIRDDPSATEEVQPVNNPIDEAEFEAYIRRRSSLSRSYRNLDLESPPRELDEAVMSLAREAHTLKRPEGREVYIRWMAPVAFAATVVLVFTVVLQVVIRPHHYSTVASGEQPSSNFADSQLPRRQPVAAPAPELRESDRAISPAHQVAASPAAAPASAMALQEAKTAAPRPAVRAEAEASGSIHQRMADAAPESVSVTAARTQASPLRRFDTKSESPTEPEAWLARIEELRRTGQAAAADEQMKLFLAKYPDYFRTHTPPPDSR